MNTLYLECAMGAAGDMLMAALYELLEDKAAFLDAMNRAFPGVELRPEGAVTCGITGTHMRVTVHGQEEHSHDVPLGAGASLHEHDHEHHHEHKHDHGHEHAHDHEHHHNHHHTTPAEILALLEHAELPEAVRADAQAVYRKIAEAESQVHGAPVEQIHFHEVGSLDAVADVTGVCLAIHMLHPDRIAASPIHLGHGQVRCAHGIVPVPAPATAVLLKGVPCYTGEIAGELCTPTGAALVAYFVQDFGPMPAMRLEKTGYGVGKKEFLAANCVRAFWGESGDTRQETVTELCCHIDDMTAEALAFAGERLMELGALDVSYTPVTMKKGRPAVSLTVVCRPEDEARLAAAVLRETSTSGVRARRCGRYVLTPSVRSVKTAYGSMRLKCCDGGGIHREKPEYEDVAAAARKTGLPFRQVWEDALAAARTGKPQIG